MMQRKPFRLEIVSSGGINSSVLFDAPPQGGPRISQVHEAHLAELYRQIHQHAGDSITFSCLPHRIAGHSCLAVKLSGDRGTVNLLLTVTGNLRWPQPEEYAHSPRWYINVPDAVDAVYLVRELAETLS
ncbi:hypothetical protein CYR55_14120 [Chimaeribacter californicus]|uniref:Uncharacterized protein n=1 Tax=Chimaeribacter californicus TaxID=2060067 RepID=A0A2N5E2U1_9GAMM|nr:hypothetical protein [Chimaeribacter californicus]PLR35036.1 hypothetical protein CYR55_14120 [Chimaeribacter californicus]